VRETLGKEGLKKEQAAADKAFMGDPQTAGIQAGTVVNYKAEEKTKKEDRYGQENRKIRKKKKVSKGIAWQRWQMS